MATNDDEIQDIEYTPSSEVAEQQASPLNEVEQVQYAKAKPGITARLGASVNNTLRNVAQGTKDYMAKQKAKKEMMQAQNPQPVRKFGKHTIRPITEPYAPPQSQQMQGLERQFYTQESGGMQAMMQSRPTNVMDKFGGSNNIMARFGGSSNIMGRFGGKASRKSPLQNMLFGSPPKRGKASNAYQKMMGKSKKTKWF